MIHSVLSHPLASLLVTLIAFSCAGWIYKKGNSHSLLNPVVLAIGFVLLFIGMSGINYQTYMQGAQYIHFLLGPATVALAIPIYKQIKLIGKEALALGGSVMAGSIVSGCVAWSVAYLLGARSDLLLSIIPKSVTTPIAISVAEKIGAIPSLTVMFVFTTGILGTLFSKLIFASVRIKNEKAIGFSLGVTCHGLGIASAFERGETAGVYSVLGMSLMGVISGILMPSVIIFLYQP